MKKLTLFALLAIVATVATLQSCSKIASLLQYDVPVQSGTITISIPPSADTVGSTAGTAMNTLNVDSIIKANTGNALGVNNITSVKLTSVTLTLLNSSAANNFANFKSCYGSVSSNSNTTPYTVNVANNPDVTSSSLSLPVDSTAELKSYLTGTTYTYGLGGVLRRATTDTLTCTIVFQFKAHVQG